MRNVILASSVLAGLVASAAAPGFAGNGHHKGGPANSGPGLVGSRPSTMIPGPGTNLSGPVGRLTAFARYLFEHNPCCLAPIHPTQPPPPPDNIGGP